VQQRIAAAVIARPNSLMIRSIASQFVVADRLLPIASRRVASGVISTELAMIAPRRSPQSHPPRVRHDHFTRGWRSKAALSPLTQSSPYPCVRQEFDSAILMVKAAKDRSGDDGAEPFRRTGRLAPG
jgi:hypothetical protein